LRDEHEYAGGITIVKDHVHELWLGQREMFVPLLPNRALASRFGEAPAMIGSSGKSMGSRSNCQTTRRA
jgi:hypothetical protein